MITDKENSPVQKSNLNNHQQSAPALKNRPKQPPAADFKTALSRSTLLYSFKIAQTLLQTIADV